jgi:hypothetical protein
MTQQRKGSFRAFRLLFAPLQGVATHQRSSPSGERQHTSLFQFRGDTFDAAG